MLSPACPGRNYAIENYAFFGMEDDGKYRQRNKWRILQSVMPIHPMAKELLSCAKNENSSDPGRIVNLI